jgi:peroxiredoxin
MKTATIVSACITLNAALAAHEFRLGEKAADFTLRDANGQSVSVPVGNGRVTVVVFFSTRCPISNAFNYRRNVMYNEFRQRVRFVAVDANANESLEEIRNYARELEFDFPVYKDVNNVVADRFGTQITTETFVIDAAGILRYRGYMEDSPNPNRTKSQGLRIAIGRVLAGQEVSMPQTKALGCSIVRSHPAP